MKIYFNDLNYSLSNEDTQIEYRLLRENSERVFSISGSGARCLPLLAKNPKRIDMTDISLAQLYLAELRVQAVKKLSYEEFLFFMGYRGAIQNEGKTSLSRMDLFTRLELSETCKNFWMENKSHWLVLGFILLGRWERHFQKLGFIFRKILRCDFSKVFAAQSLEEQRDLYRKFWPHRRWASFLKIAASEFVFNQFLYKGQFSGSSDKKTEAQTPSQFIRLEFDRVIETQLLRKNYFFQILFLGEIRYEEGLPFEAHHSIFEKMKNSTSEIHYVHSDLLHALTQGKYDFISLSDTISYLPQSSASTLLKAIAPHTLPNARIVIRSFLRKPTQMLTQGWIRLQEAETEALKNDGTAVYRFDIFEKEGLPL